MTPAFDVDLEMGHLSGKSLQKAMMGALTIADTMPEHVVEEPQPDDYDFVDDDYYGGPQAGTSTHGTCSLVQLTPKLFSQMRPVQREVLLYQLMERVAPSVCTSHPWKKLVVLTISKVTATATPPGRCGISIPPNLRSMTVRY